MWYTWTLLLVSCALVEAAEVEEVATTVEAVPLATTRAPPRTLDRQAAELAWKTWLQSPESGNQNGPARRITTKSLFITPLVCPKGQRLDRNGCVQVVTVEKDEHERILLDQLNALFTSPANGDVLYDYGDDEPGPLQLSIPIGLDPQAAPLQGQEPSAQAQELQANYVKKVEKHDVGASLEAELELLQLQHSHNNTALPEGAGVLNHNVLTNMHYPEKPKRDNSGVNLTDIDTFNSTADEGQKEIVYGHVNVDPILYDTENQNHEAGNIEHDKPADLVQTQNNTISVNNTTSETINSTSVNTPSNTESLNTQSHVLKKDGDHSSLNPENDYSDISEAIKLISRYAEVTTDDDFTKDQNKPAVKDDGVLGTRTKLQYRRNKPKPSDETDSLPLSSSNAEIKEKVPTDAALANNGVIYRYPWQSEHTATPPPDYPFRHLQDYWPGQNKKGGVYNTHENPRRHHHSYPHNFRPHAYPYGPYPALQQPYPEQLKRYIHRVAQRRANPLRFHNNDQDLYSLLGLRHWFSSEGTAKR